MTLAVPCCDSKLVMWPQDISMLLLLTDEAEECLQVGSWQPRVLLWGLDMC